MIFSHLFFSFCASLMIFILLLYFDILNLRTKIEKNVKRNNKICRNHFLSTKYQMRRRKYPKLGSINFWRIQNIFVLRVGISNLTSQNLNINFLLTSKITELQSTSNFKQGGNNCQHLITTYQSVNQTLRTLLIRKSQDRGHAKRSGGPY